MDDEADEWGISWEPLRVLALYATTPDLANPLLREVLGEQFIAVDDCPGGVRITHPALLGVTLDGDPTWGGTLLRPAAMPELGELSWWPEPAIADAAGRGTGAIAVDEDLPHGIEAWRRIASLSAVLRALAAATPVLAFAWPFSGRLTAPVATDSGWGYVGVERRPSGVAADGWIIASQGLAPLAIPEHYCHFVGLDPDAVAGSVYRHALAALAGEDLDVDDDLGAAGIDEPWLEAICHDGPGEPVVELIPRAPYHVDDERPPGRRGGAD